jgi:hypothetical protein
MCSGDEDGSDTENTREELFLVSVNVEWQLGVLLEEFDERDRGIDTQVAL